MYSYDASLMPNSTCKIGIMTANEKRLNIVERILKKIFRKRFFLYGETKRTNILTRSLNIIQEIKYAMRKNKSNTKRQVLT